jgi:MOSC domain-containing protein YiiM
LRQALLVDAAVFAELAQRDIHIGPGMMGENITIEGIDVMQLLEGTHLAIGSAIVEVIERRNPCYQLNGIDPRLLKAVVKKMPEKIIFKAGMMTRILQSGWVRAGDLVEVLPPADLYHSVNVTDLRHSETPLARLPLGGHLNERNETKCIFSDMLRPIMPLVLW